MNTLLDQILATTYRENKIGSLDTIKKVLKTKKSFKYLSLEEKSDAINILGTAYLSLLKLEKASTHFKQINNSAGLESVFNLAVRHGKYGLVKDMMKYGTQNNIVSFQKILGSYSEFLQQKALPYVPLYWDDSEGFSINEEILNGILSEIKGVRGEILAEVVKYMEAKGSLNIVKKYILAHYSQKTSLIQRYEGEFNKRAEAGRQNIFATLNNYCQREGFKLISQLQIGDNNNYFPSVAHIFLVEKNGKQYVFKENIKLHQDYSRLAGYSVEKEILDIIKYENVVNYLCSLNVGDFEFLVLDFIPGTTLERYVLADNLLPVDKVIKIIKSLAKVINCLHQNNIICMDVKDKNVMYDGQKVTYFDFGVSQIITDEKLALPEPYISSLLTTPEYVSPEMALTFKAYKETDVFQLGILFYKLLVGKNPFVKYNLYDFVEGDSYRESEIIKFVLPTIFNDFDKSPEVINKNPKILKLLNVMLEKDFRKRPNSGELLKLLEEIES